MSPSSSISAARMSDPIQPDSPVNHRALLRLLQSQPVFCHWSTDELIAITPFVRKINLTKGQTLRINCPDEQLAIYFVIKGELQVCESSRTKQTTCTKDNENKEEDEGKTSHCSQARQPCTPQTFTAGAHGIGLSNLLDTDIKSSTLVATCNSVVYAVPTHLFPSLNQTNQEKQAPFLAMYFQRWFPSLIKQDVLTAPAEQHTNEPDESGATLAEAEDNETNTRQIWKTVLSWLVAISVPIMVFLFSEMYDLSWSQEYYLIILSGCLVLLLLGLVADYAAVLAAALACLLLDIVPVDVVMSGFASGGFFMALSIFGLGSVLVRSGLATRLVLFIFRLCPETRFWQNFAILCTGILLTPCLPSANTRLTLLAPLVKNTSRAVGYPDKSQATTQMMASMFFGCTLFSPFFLTGKSLNFVMYDMLPQQVSEEYQWMNWLIAAGGLAVLLLVGYLLATQWIFRHSPQPLVSKTHLATQWKLKGKLDKAEWIALIGIVLFINAITQYGFHKISLFWVGFGFFVVFLMVDALSDDNIGNDIEWDALLLIGFFIGLENALKYTGISHLITNGLSDVTATLDGNPYLFVCFNIALISMLRLFLPITTTGVLVGSISLPLAKVNGFDPWLTCLIILILVECWFYPKQATYNASYSAACQGELTHDPVLFQHINLVSIAIRITGLFVFIYALEWMGKI